MDTSSIIDMLDPLGTLPGRVANRRSQGMAPDRPTGLEVGLAELTAGRWTCRIYDGELSFLGAGWGRTKREAAEAAVERCRRNLG